MPLFAVGPGTARVLEKDVIGGEGGWMRACWVEGGEDAGRGEKLVHTVVSRCHMEDEGVQERGGGENEKGKEEKEVRKKKKVLWLTGEKRREALRMGLEDAGIEVDCCVIYSTSLSPDFLRCFTHILGKQQRQHQKQPINEEQQEQHLPPERIDKKTSGDDEEEEEVVEEGVRWVVVFSTQGSREILMGLDLLDEKTGKVKRGFDEQEKRRTFVASIGGTTAEHLEEEFGFKVDAVAESPSPEGVRAGIEGFMSRKGLLL